MSFATNHRFSIVSFAIAATATLALNGTMLMGFNQLAVNGAHSEADIVRLARIAPNIPAVMLERVVVTTRHA
jgi:hypothetical protein